MCSKVQGVLEQRIADHIAARRKPAGGDISVLGVSAYLLSILSVVLEKNTMAN